MFILKHSSSAFSALTHALVIVTVSATFGCSQESPFKQPTPPSATTPVLAHESVPVPSNHTVSAEAAATFAAILTAIQLNPERNAVDEYAKASKWKETPTEMNAMLNAKRGYFGKLSGHTILLGSDGTNDIFSIMVRDGFDDQAFINHLNGALTFKHGGSDTSMGQKIDIYRIFDGDRSIGIGTITYGVAGAIKGMGTVGFISNERTRKEGIGDK